MRRSASLQWSLGGARASAAGLDVRGRLLAALTETLAAANGRPVPAPRLDPEALPALLAGRGLTDVRLLVAGAGSDPAPQPRRAHHG